MSNDGNDVLVLYVAGRLVGRTVINIEIAFPGPPPYDDLIGHCEGVFNAEARRLTSADAFEKKKNTARHSASRGRAGKGPSSPSPTSTTTPTIPTAPFVVDSIKVYVDDINRWVEYEDLERMTPPRQLAPYSQLYLYQPNPDERGEGVSVEDSEQGLIIPPPLRIRSPAEERRNHREDAFFLFHDMDLSGNGHLDREEMQRIFNVLCVYDYSERAVDAWFHEFDSNKDGVLSLAEFSRFAAANPDVVGRLLSRSEAYWRLGQECGNPLIDGSYCISRELRDVIYNQQQALAI